MAGVPKTIAELSAIVDALTLRVEALEKAKPVDLSDLTSRVTVLEKATPPDTSAVVKQVQANSAALAQARADLDKFLGDAGKSIQLIDLFGEVLNPLLENDRASAIEQVRKWERLRGKR